MATNVRQAVRDICEPIARQMGLYFVDVENARMGKSRLIRIYIDRDGGVDMDACEAFHRAIVDPLEEVAYDYLEVSSPGDRPLKSEADFLRMQGREVEVHLYAAQDGKKRYEGVLCGAQQDEIEIRDFSGAARTFQKRDVSAVKPLFRVDVE